MNPSAFFIRRPIATTLLAIGLAIAGIVAFILLPVSSLPEIDFPTISVSASLPGASPEIMATSVATPLERQLGRIAGITQMTSTSNLGSTTINVQFDLTRDINGAASDVQAAINAASSNLPPNLPNSPTYRKVNPADSPILIIALTSEIYSTGQMYDVASTILQQKLSQVNGVGQVIVGGSSLPAVRIELNPTALNHYGISLETVRTAIANNNANTPKGQLTIANKQSDIVANDQLFRAYQYKPLIIAYNNGAPVRLSDVGDVNDSVENIRTAGLADGKPAVMLILFRSPGANVISTVENVNKALPQLSAAIPAGINMYVTMDRTTTIRASLHDVEMTLVIAIVLVVLVAYLFLKSGRAALIPTVAVPLSLLGTFAIMYLCGFSLDNLSLMALTISTGFVVDDAVVVLENTTRHIEDGMHPMEAALRGAKEVGFTVMSMSISLIAVFVPILFMGGLVGRLFREFAITLSVAILVSLIISLTVTPMMCSRLLRPPKAVHEITKDSSRAFQKMWAFYKRSLNWSLQHSKIMLCVPILAVILTIILFIIVPKGFFPQQDTGRIIASIQAEQDISFQSLRKKLADYVGIIKQDPAVEHAAGFIGGSNNTTNSGSIYITLKSLSERHHVSVDKIIDRLRNKVASVPGATLYMQAAQDLVVGGRQGNAQFQYTLFSTNLKELNKWAPLVMKEMTTIPGIIDVNSDQLNNGLQVYVTYDHDTALRFGITSQTIDSILYDAFGQEQISIMYTLMNQYHVVMEVAPQFWQNPESLQAIYVPSSTGKVVPLSAIAKFDRSTTLLAVTHQNQFPSATISFNLLPNVALGDVVSKITHIVDNMHVPKTIVTIFQGSAQAFQQSLATQPLLILLALVAVYIVLGILYESTIHPITILSTLPTAGVGAILALLVTDTELSIIALIGIILLIGIVKKNAIMMIDFALEAERVENKSSRDSIYQAALLRFRPIMMTTMAAIFGAFPLAFGMGIGSELRRPLGITIIGGLVVSQMLTLYTTPVIYLWMEKAGNWLRMQRMRLANYFRPSAHD